MTYTLQAIVGTRAVLGSRHEDGLDYIELNGGLVMVPLISELRDSHGIPDLPLTDEADEAVVPGPLEAVCRKLSQHGLVAYLEAEFWGGQGMQAHALFRAGVALGLPVVAEDAINQALRQFGVQPGPHHDEFEAVGLGRHRDTDDWVDEQS
jgi:hypothetical protein